ncbi:uncharacterized protein LOC130709433 [Balaenoptera acutorostrata]|uniref:Uncharacterized protein LOC130709433 n=1 Tax=Balaenoptera acutorostrata TaxID=9767 RepID=A0ABM3UK09_BALAC|nr:uncharacterized protein LOC130709433 [Balaenoptera acutorostrata]
MGSASVTPAEGPRRRLGLPAAKPAPLVSRPPRPGAGQACRGRGGRGGPHCQEDRQDGAEEERDWCFILTSSLSVRRKAVWLGGCNPREFFISGEVSITTEESREKSVPEWCFILTSSLSFHRKAVWLGGCNPREFFITREVSITTEGSREKSVPDRLLGVHCTHGFNRTGYLMCRYLIDVEGMWPDDAIEYWCFIFTSSPSFHKKAARLLVS